MLGGEIDNRQFHYIRVISPVKLPQYHIVRLPNLTSLDVQPGMGTMVWENDKGIVDRGMQTLKSLSHSYTSSGNKVVTTAQNKFHLVCSFSSVPDKPSNLLAA
jgi:hypothetical protein